MVDVGFILPSSHTTIVNSPNHAARTHLVPLPSYEGCGPIAVIDGSNCAGERETRGGTHETGGPGGASKNESRLLVVVRFRPFLFVVTVDHLA